MTTDTSQKSDGGSAFPIEGGDFSGLYPEPGMRLRDWFAGQALVAIGLWTPGTDIPSWEFSEMRKRRAEWAYRQADAMIAAREAGR